MTVANIRLDKAYLTAIWLETMFYGLLRFIVLIRHIFIIVFFNQGMNVVLFGSYLFVSRYKRKQPRVNRAIMTTGIFMFLFSTIHVSLGFQRLIEGFIVLRNQPGGPAAFFSDVSIPANVAKVCIHTINVSHFFYTISVHATDSSVTQSILGDSIVVR